jgi:ABC-type branched-subunit amino acid transport system permease subunit
VLGALLLLPAEELARWATDGRPGAAMVLYGLLLMVVIRFMPGGLIQLFRFRPFKWPRTVQSRRKAA